MWLSVDPLAEKYPSISPYNYCASNPILFVDPDGRDITPWYYGGLHIYSKIASHAYKSFETGYFSLLNNSKVFLSSIKRLENSKRTYTFQTVNKNKKNATWGGYFQPSQDMYDRDNTINFVVDGWNNKLKGTTSTIFEEVVHAAQCDYYKDNKEWTDKTLIGMEVEAKLAKAIEGLELQTYEAFDVDNKILAKIRNGNKLSINELRTFSDAVDLLAFEISLVYGINSLEFNGKKDLKYIEKIYGQKLYENLFVEQKKE
jgi:hypothetical protein